MKERQKRGEKCGMQIAKPDMVEDAKQRSRLRRKEEREALDQERVLKEAQVEIELQERVEAAEAEAEAERRKKEEGIWKNRDNEEERRKKE